MPFPPRVAPLPRRRLVDDATQALREAILRDDFPQGERLRQVELADRLGISRTPVREALGRLAHEGLVELLPRGGVRVSRLDVDGAVELYDLREVLDGLAARLAATRAEAGAITRLGRAVDQMGAAIRRRDPNPWFDAHVAFHDEIFRASAHARLRGLSGLVSLSIRRFHPFLLTTPRRLEDAHHEHGAILAAIVARDGDAAERLARLHIVNAKEIVLKALTGGHGHGALQA